MVASKTLPPPPRPPPLMGSPRAASCAAVCSGKSPAGPGSLVSFWSPSSWPSVGVPAVLELSPWWLFPPPSSPRSPSAARYVCCCGDASFPHSLFFRLSGPKCQSSGSGKVATAVAPVSESGRCCPGAWDVLFALRSAERVKTGVLCYALMLVCECAPSDM
ncbi:uncharacterized protein B0I36DRAFT_333789 [Microdochium trichocladiopsis]|uniref:Uncharacterized protein n=1 Tax=Microdochium trichocladiopsis TaxID=1682393 RepID=A0A9P8XY17_9PEZI|nr:uncharacterized protein B0I36DRAFT_333789 [Microdochium trichocladiopsis]KAH7021105.1 hypothetical protein B0I36DRAFT_333789 [Microdochium trichocladiopsis]